MPIYNYCPSVGEKPRETLVQTVSENSFPGLGTITMSVSQIESFQIFVKWNNNVTINNC